MSSKCRSRRAVTSKSFKRPKNEIEIKRVKRDWEDEDDLRDLKILDEMRKRQFESMEKIQALKHANLAMETEQKVKLGQGLRDVPSYVAAGVLPGDHGQRVIGALEALRPQPQVTVIQGYSPAMPQAHVASLIHAEPRCHDQPGRLASGDPRAALPS